jgi:hypothetical protein
LNPKFGPTELPLQGRAIEDGPALEFLLPSWPV